MLSVKGVTVKYGKKYALDHIDLEFSNGVYGLIGKNGAGKTTLINVITGILKPDAGNVYWEGVSIHKLKSAYYKEIGYGPQYPKLYKDYTGYQFIKYMCKLKGIKFDENILNIIDEVNLKECINKKIGTYSGGMRQRLSIAQALIGNPHLIILDEPTAGLDPVERISFRNLLSKLSENKIIIVATHILQDIESIAKKIIVLKEGKLDFNCSPSELAMTMKNKIEEKTISYEHLSDYEEKYIVCNVLNDENGYKIRYIVDKDIVDKEKQQVIPQLEDAFLYYNLGENDDRKRV